MPDDLSIRRIDREMRDVRQRFVDGSVPLDEMTERLSTLEAKKRALSAAPVASHGPSADEAEAMLTNFARTWGLAGENERADLIHALIAKVEVRGPNIAAVTLTPSAYEHGFALALPERSLWRAREDSNLRPSGPQPDALSTELRAPVRGGWRRGRDSNPRKRKPPSTV
jgi:hypothetical protein